LQKQPIFTGLITPQAVDSLPLYIDFPGETLQTFITMEQKAQNKAKKIIVRKFKAPQHKAQIRNFFYLVFKISKEVISFYRIDSQNQTKLLSLEHLR
jgi:hypothetical protein